MKNLLIKEFRLSLHPTAFIFILLAFMMMIPNYPLYVTFFYIGLSFFFTCLSARENKDYLYTMLLPVRKKDVAVARCMILFIFQMIEVLACAAVCLLRNTAGIGPNEAGMDANVAFFGIAFVMMALFNIVFLPMYYRNVNHVGIPFAVASLVMFFAISVETVLDFTVPFFRDVLDSPDPEHMTSKLTVLAIGIAVYLIASALALCISVRRFRVQDLA